ncbi:MAG: hypothetical protein IPJ19_18785 [Planctomycetes bacterium]|nr:hypothetical protein [Planctomycetota bacterium]
MSGRAEFGANEITIGKDPVDLTVDLSSTGCVEWIPSRTDGTRYDGPLQILVRYDPQRPGAGTYIFFSRAPYVLHSVREGTYAAVVEASNSASQASCELTAVRGQRRTIPVVLRP